METGWMTAMEILEPGGPEVLRPARRPIPQPGSGEVLLRLDAAGVNRPDIMQRKGLYPPPDGASDIPGLEVAGEIAALGTGVAGLQLGERVCALVAGGGYAEYCLADQGLCLPFPKGLDAVQAAVLPETLFTVWTNLFDSARLRSGETLLVHGGSSGIGSVAIQLARCFGARVIATAGSAEKCRFCEGLGATAIDYRKTDFVAAVASATEGRGVDVILDMIGGEYLQRNLEALAVDGRLVLIALQGGARAEVNLLPFLLKRVRLTGSTLRPRSLEQKAAIARSLRQLVWPWLDAGRIAPIVHARFPLTAAADAHRLMESGAHMGKIVLTLP
jgi:NADPH:quinone reductase